jgi:hypothetical protein
VHLPLLRGRRRDMRFQRSIGGHLFQTSKGWKNTIRLTAEGTTQGCLQHVRGLSRNVNFGFGYGFWERSVRNFDDRALSKLSRFWSCGRLLLVMEITMGGYHLIMSVISFVAFQRAVLGDVSLWKVVLLLRCRVRSLIAASDQAINPEYLFFHALFQPLI